MRAHVLPLGLLLAACGAEEDPPAEEITPFPVPESAWSIGDPTPEEQESLELANRLRADPAAEVDRLLETPRVRTLMQTYGMTEEQLRADFATYAPVPPLAFDSRLIEAARRHARDLSEHHPVGDANPHAGSDGSNAGTRARDAGYTLDQMGENIMLYGAEGPYTHASFAVDWGRPRLDHRINLLDLRWDGEDRLIPAPHRDAGIGILPISGDNYGPYVVVQEIASELRSTTVLLTGVAFTDANGDGFYQPGEGVGGIDVVPEVGGFHAITSASGGYAIPFVPGEGPTRLQLQKDGKVVAEHEADIQQVNVKLDFLL